MRVLSECIALYCTVQYHIVLYSTKLVKIHVFCISVSTIDSLKALITTSKSPITNWKKGDDVQKVRMSIYNPCTMISS